MRNQLHPFTLAPLIVGTLSLLCAAAPDVPPPTPETPAASADKPTTPAPAAPTTPRVAPVSAAFQDVLKRVELRDADSGAIREVRPRDDAPRYGNSTLEFKLAQRGDDECVLVLQAHTMTADIYEQYRLKLDQALRDEITRQKLYEQQQIEKHKQWVEAQKIKVPAVTRGQFQFGASVEDVKKARGTPKEEYVHQKAGAMTLIYADLTFTFDGGLVDVRQTEK